MDDRLIDLSLTDWRSEWLAKHTGEHVAILLPIGGSPEPLTNEENVEDLYRDLEREVEPHAGAPVRVEHVDPYFGAGGYGIGVIWEIIDHGADLLAWITAAIATAPRIRATLAHLVQRIGTDADIERFFLSAEALKVLVVAEVCEAKGLAPRDIDSVVVTAHTPRLSEPTVEKRQMYSVYTISVRAYRTDDYYHVWEYVLTSLGHIVAECHVKIPLPNRTHWSRMQLPRRRLTGLP